MSATRSETFGRLLKAGIASIANCEGKTAPAIEDDLGAQIGIAGKSIQRYKAGHIPPEPRAVQILAEACTQRGMMGREWLEAFLHHARYPFAERLLQQLRPLSVVRDRPPRVYENLPAPTYSQFVMREQAFGEVLDGLQQRSAAVLIIGMGGCGKTSLAREAAAFCLRDPASELPTDAVVWVSDKDHPGTINLSVVLNEVARTLDYSNIAQLASDEKRREIEQLLRRQRVLLIVDNFETVTDTALVTWLLRLPEPSKALITSREYNRAFRNSTVVIELRGMSEAEAQVLISQRLRALRLERLTVDQAQIESLLAATGGNPKAIEMTLGLVKHERRPLPQIVDDLYTARGDLFDDLFARAWEALDESARRVLLVATFFPASASGGALRATSDVQGFAFDRAVERLVDLALLDVERADLSAPPRYTLHPLVRAFACAKTDEYAEVEPHARNRWVRWWDMQLKQSSSAASYAAVQLDIVNVLAVHTWLLEHGRVNELSEQLWHSYYLLFAEGRWQELVSLSEAVMDWAEATGNTYALRVVLRTLTDIASNQGRIAETVQWMDRIEASACNAGNDHLNAELMLNKAHYDYQRYSIEARHSLAEQALATFRHYQDREGELIALNTLGNLSLLQYQYSAAQRYYEEAQRLLAAHERDIHWPYQWEAVLTGNLGMVAGRQGDYGTGRDLLLKILDRLADLTDRAEVYAALALYERHLGDQKQAASYRQFADAIIERLRLARPISAEDAAWMRLEGQKPVSDHDISWLGLNDSSPGRITSTSSSAED